MNKVKLSAVYITKDAGAHFRTSLASVVDLVEDIVVVDSGSRDDTLTLAEAAGARIYQRPWPGFGAQRQYAVEQAKTDWVLVIDGDEVLRPEGCARIRALFERPLEAAAYALRRRSYIGRRAIRHGDWGEDWVLRLLDRRRGHYDAGDLVHESWRCAAPGQRLPGLHLDHYTFASYADMLTKLARYGRLNAEQLYRRGRPIGSRMAMNHAVAAFLRSYVLRLGFLDGVDGAAIAWTTALGSFMKYAIAYEMQREQP
ncbi:MAG: glycosyltransferase family 2 protein [Acidithiobacillus caldus]|nr:glycosyltransferase family 2 protein [Acidithiobacillus caldus]